MHSLVNDLLEEKKLQQNISGLASLDFFFENVSIRYCIHFYFTLILKNKKDNIIIKRMEWD